MSHECGINARKVDKVAKIPRNLFYKNRDES
jgi:hypothetical protein